MKCPSACTLLALTGTGAVTCRTPRKLRGRFMNKLPTVLPTRHLATQPALPASPRSPHEWRERTPGTYGRRQDTRERMIIRQVESTPQCAGMVNECMHFAARLALDPRRFPDPAAALRRAWVALHHDHPSMALRAAGEDMLYSVVDDRTVESWADETFRVRCRTSTEQGQTLASLAEWYPRIPGTRSTALNYFPATGEILLQATHEIIDGVGGFMLLDNLCRRLATLDSKGQPELLFGPHVANLTPPLELAASVPDSTPETLAEARSMISTWQAKGSSQPQLLLATDRGGQTDNNTPHPLRPGRARLQFTPEETTSLLCGAKQRNVSTRDLTHAAVVYALKKYMRLPGGAPPSSANWLGGMPRSVRDLCRPPFSTAAHPAAPYFVSSLAHVEDPANVWDAARQLRAQREVLAADKDILRLVKPFAELLSETKGGRAAPTATAAVARGPVMYSGLGVVDGFFANGRGEGGVRLDDVYILLHKCTPSVLAVCQTLRGRLSFTVSYNTGYYSEGHVQGYMRVVESLLRESFA